MINELAPLVVNGACGLQGGLAHPVIGGFRKAGGDARSLAFVSGKAPFGLLYRPRESTAEKDECCGCRTFRFGMNVRLSELA